MNIISKRGKKCQFSNIEIGEAFKYNNGIFMKFAGIFSNSGVYNAINLEDGTLARFLANTEAERVDLDLVIH